MQESGTEAVADAGRIDLRGLGNDVDVDALTVDDVDALPPRVVIRVPTIAATWASDRPVFCRSRPYSYSLVNR